MHTITMRNDTQREAVLETYRNRTKCRLVIYVTENGHKRIQELYEGKLAGIIKTYSDNFLHIPLERIRLAEDGITVINQEKLTR